jgi:hypothetical protein
LQSSAQQQLLPLSKLGSHHVTAGSAAVLLMETTTETFESSADASIDSSTPFRFTSFPASLPRVNNLPLRHSSSSLFGKDTTGGAQTVQICGPPSVRKRMSFGDILSVHRSSHQAASHDSSFSSLLLDSGDENAQESHHRQGHMDPQHLVLSEAFHPDQPNSAASAEAFTTTGTPAPRTRLNFSTVTSPAMNDPLATRGMNGTKRQI